MGCARQCAQRLCCHLDAICRSCGHAALRCAYAALRGGQLAGAGLASAVSGWVSCQLGAVFCFVGGECSIFDGLAEARRGLQSCACIG